MAGKNIMREIGDTMEKIFYKKKEPKPVTTTPETATPEPAKAPSLAPVDTVRLDIPYQKYAEDTMLKGEKPLSKEEWARNMREGR